MWIYTILEIYPKPLNGAFPADGEPADWIEEGRVMWAQGEDDTVILATPLVRILRVKVRQWADEVYGWIFDNLYANERFPWGRAWRRRMDELWRAFGIADDAVIERLLGSDQWKDDLAALVGDVVPEMHDGKPKRG